MGYSHIIKWSTGAKQLFLGCCLQRWIGGPYLPTSFLKDMGKQEAATCNNCWLTHLSVIKCPRRGLKWSWRTQFGNLQVSWILYIKGVGHPKANSPKRDTQRKLLNAWELLVLIINKWSFFFSLSLSFLFSPSTHSFLLPTVPPLSLSLLHGLA